MEGKAPHLFNPRNLSTAAVLPARQMTYVLVRHCVFVDHITIITGDRWLSF